MKWEHVIEDMRNYVKNNLNFDTEYGRGIYPYIFENVNVFENKLQ